MDDVWHYCKKKSDPGRKYDGRYQCNNALRDVTPRTLSECQCTPKSTTFLSYYCYVVIKIPS
jgi:hypothetical protein